jgi:2'-5' RNA ligase
MTRTDEGPARRTALVVAVPEAATAVEPWLERTAAAKPSLGIPAHVTVLFPFVPAHDANDALLGDLASVFVRVHPFTFVLRECRRFPAVLYLAPEPSAPFIAMTESVVAAYPDFPPYEGVFDSIVPHLTVAEGLPAVLNRAQAEVRPWLPIQAEADEVLLLEEVDPVTGEWSTRARVPLGAA